MFFLFLNKGIYPNFTSYVIFFLHDQAIGSLEAGGKIFTDPWKMMMLTVAVYQQLHEKEKKFSHSLKATDTLERTGKKRPALSFPSAHILPLPSTPSFSSQV